MEGRGVWNKAISLIFGKGFVKTLADSSCVLAGGRGMLFLECNARRNKITMTPSKQITLEKTEILSKRYRNNSCPWGVGRYVTTDLKNISFHRYHINM